MTDDNGVADTKIVTALKARKIAQEEVNLAIQKHIAQLQLDKQALTDLESKIASGISYEEAYAQSMTKASVAAKEHAIQTKGLSGTTDTFIAKQKVVQNELEATAHASNVASTAMKALSIAGNMIAMWAFSKILEIVANKFDEIANSAENCAERVENLLSNFNSAIETAKSHEQSVEKIADRYEELSKGVNNLGENVSLTSDEYAEYNNIVNDIADMFPTMIQGYTDEGNAILKLKGNVDALREAYEAEAQAAYNSLIMSGEDSDGNDIVSNYKDIVNGADVLFAEEAAFGAKDSIDILKKLQATANNGEEFKKVFWELKSMVEENSLALNGDEFQKILKDIGINNAWDNARLDWNDETYQKFAEELAKNSSMIQSYIQTYNAEIDSALSNVETLANAYLMTNEDYAKLDEQSQNAASIIVNSLNTEIASGFEDKIDVGEYVSEIVNILSSNPDAKKAMVGLFTMDTTDMPVDDIEYWTNEYINTIANFIGEDPVELRVRLGFDNSETQSLVNNVKDKLQGTAFDERVGELSLGDLKIASELEVPLDSIESWEELLELIKNVKSETFKIPDLTPKFDYENLDGLESKVSSIQSAYDTLISAMEQYNEQGYLDMEMIDSLIALDDAYINVLIDENGQLQYNSETFKKLAEIKLEEAKTSLYQELCTELVRIKELETAIATNELALANGTLTESAYETAKALYEEVLAMGETKSALATNAWNATKKKVALLDSQLKNVTTSTYNFAKSSGSASKTTKKEFSETVDFMTERIEELNNALDLLKANLENVVGSFAKNKLIDAEITINKESINNYSDALDMYTEKANEALSKLPSDIAEKVKNGAVSLTTFMGDSNESVVEAIKEYDNWADKIHECQISIVELKKTIENLELSKFSNIIEDFNNQFDIRENGKKLIDQTKEWIESTGSLVGDSFFSSQIAQGQKQLLLLEEEKKQLVNQMASALSSGNVKTGSEAFLSMINSLSEVEGSIIDVKTELEELDTELQNLHWKVFDKVQDNFNNLHSEIDNLVGLFDDADVVDDNGIFSKEALSNLGLLTQKFELAEYQVASYGEQIAKLNQDYLDGKYSLLEYQERLATLTDEQWNAVNASEEVKNAIISLHETRVDEIVEGIEKEKEAYREVIEVQLELIDATEDLISKREELEGKSKTVTDLERQIAAMMNDDSQATVAKRLKLEEELAEAKKDLESTERRFSVESQKEALQKQLEDFESEKDNEIDILKEALNDEETLITQSFETVKQNATIIGQQITQTAKQHGVQVSTTLTSSWQQGENAIASYGTVLSAQSSAFIGNIMGVENEVWNLQAQANETANSLAWMFSTQADNLVNELNESAHSELNLQNMTNALQQSLINTLERGYDVSNITSALSAIEDAADKARESIEGMLGTQADADSPQTSKSTASKQQLGNRYKVVDSNGTAVTKSGLSYAQAVVSLKEQEKLHPNKKGSYDIVKYATGGIITKDDNNPLNNLAKAVGEDVIVAAKDTESILTPVQTEGLLKLAPMLDKFNNLWNVPNFTTPSLPQVVPKNTNQPIIHYDSFLTVNGDINDTNHFVGQVRQLAREEARIEDTKNAKKILSAISH